MSKRFLVLTKSDTQRIREIIEHAFANPVLPLAMQASCEGILPPFCEYPEHCIYIRDGFRCVFTVDVYSHPDYAGKYRHLSVSVNGPDEYANKNHVECLMKLFGFQANSIEEATMGWIDDGAESIDVMELIENEPPKKEED